MSSKLTVNYGLRWDWFSREQERESEQANMVTGHSARSQYLIPADWKSKPLSPSFVSNLAKDGIQLVYTDEFGSGLGKMPKTNFAPRVDAAYEIAPKIVLRSGYGLFYGAFENRGGNPSLGYNYPFQFTAHLQRRRTTPRRTGCRMDRSSVSTPAPAGPRSGHRQRQRADAARCRVRLQDAAVSQLQRDAADRSPCANHSVEIGFVGTQGRHLETFTGMNNVHAAAAAGHQPAAVTCSSPISRAARCDCGRSASARTIRCRPSSSGAITPGCSSCSATR